MKTKLLKISSFLLLLLSLFTLTSCNLKGLTLDEAKANLEAAGYEVKIIDGATYCDSDQNEFFLFSSELENYLYAEKGDDKIHMFFFYTIDQASRNSDFIDYPDLLGGQTNQLVYCATRQARKDAKL